VSIGSEAGRASVDEGSGVQAMERVDHNWVALRAAELIDFGDGCVDRPCRFVRAWMGERVEGVGRLTIRPASGMASPAR
jgi:hypothetical protein